MSYLAMMLKAKPIDIKRLRVIGMMGLHINCSATYLARLANEFSGSDCTCDRIPSPHSLRMLSSAPSLIFHRLSFAFRILKSNSFVGSILISHLRIIIPYILRSAFLAFIKMPIRHLRMGIKFSEGFHYAAFEARFHTIRKYA